MRGRYRYCGLLLGDVVVLALSGCTSVSVTYSNLPEPTEWPLAKRRHDAPRAYLTGDQSGKRIYNDSGLFASLVPRADMSDLTISVHGCLGL